MSENVRYLLWSRHIEPSRWEGMAASWARCGLDRARAILRGQAPTPDELASLSAATGVAEPELAYGRLVEGTDILEKNLSHVFEHAEHGEKGKAAGELGVHRATVSAWLSGRQRPRGARLDKLAIRLGLRRGEDLETTPLFLSMEPISASQRRAWLHERIDAVSDHTLAELFPALKRLLGEP